jgi:pilus assembly protein CpaF
MMVAMTGLELPVSVVRQYIAAGIKLVVHLTRLKGGVRRITRISEIVEVADGNYKIQDIFGFRQLGVDESKMAFGEFYATGYLPSCVERMHAAGEEISDEMFRECTLAG